VPVERVIVEPGSELAAVTAARKVGQTVTAHGGVGDVSDVPDTV
jgi:hypothetical protein